jgi:hypothetical protein
VPRSARTVICSILALPRTPLQDSSRLLPDRPLLKGMPQDQHDAHTDAQRKRLHPKKVKPPKLFKPTVQAVKGDRAEQTGPEKWPRNSSGDSYFTGGQANVVGPVNPPFGPVTSGTGAFDSLLWDEFVDEFVFFRLPTRARSHLNSPLDRYWGLTRALITPLESGLIRT